MCLGLVFFTLIEVYDVYQCRSHGNREVILPNALSDGLNRKQLQKHKHTEKQGLSLTHDVHIYSFKKVKTKHSLHRDKQSLFYTHLL